MKEVIDLFTVFIIPALVLVGAGSILAGFMRIFDRDDTGEPITISRAIYNFIRGTIETAVIALIFFVPIILFVSIISISLCHLGFGDGVLPETPYF